MSEAVEQQGSSFGNVTLTPAWLVVPLGCPHEVISWAVVGGGRRTAEQVVWLYVRSADLPPSTEPEAFLSGRMEAAGHRGSVGLMTATRLDRYTASERSFGDVAARCIATVGLGNALRAGDPPSETPAAGTVNLLCQVSRPLGEEALFEALALAAEARAAALIEVGVPSQVSGAPATGTGTDCIVVAAPRGEPLARLRWAGKHTVIGHLIGATVHAAVRAGAENWQERHRS